MGGINKEGFISERFKTAAKSCDLYQAAVHILYKATLHILSSRPQRSGAEGPAVFGSAENPRRTQSIPFNLSCPLPLLTLHHLWRCGSLGDDNPREKTRRALPSGFHRAMRRRLAT